MSQISVSAEMISDGVIIGAHSITVPVQSKGIFYLQISIADLPTCVVYKQIIMERDIQCTIIKSNIQLISRAQTRSR